MKTSFITIAEVKRAVSQVGELGLADTDAEAAHIVEDELHQRVLQDIAKGAPNAKQLAEEALKTLEIDFCRWYA